MKDKRRKTPKGTPRTVGGMQQPRGGSKVPTTNQQLHVPGDDDCPVFSFRFADSAHEGSWSWMNAEESHEVLEFMRSIGSTTWNDLKQHMSNGHKKHHYQDFGTVCREARDRLAELRHDEKFEDLFRFRLGSRRRLWGFQVEKVFYVLWWDADHKVYPAEPG